MTEKGSTPNDDETGFNESTWEDDRMEEQEESAGTNDVRQMETCIQAFGPAKKKRIIKGYSNDSGKHE